MMTFKLFLVAVPVFFAIDMLWLGGIAKKFYGRQLAGKLRKPPNWTAAVIFYLIFVLGLVVFVVVPAVDAASFTRALGYGAFFGFVTYATYDLTNLATLEDWPLTMTIVDLAWGAVLAASVSSITYWIGTEFVL
jgi:uncharacterized membrane protein